MPPSRRSSRRWSPDIPRRWCSTVARRSGLLDRWTIFRTALPTTLSARDFNEATRWPCSWRTDLNMWPFGWDSQRLASFRRSSTLTSDWAVWCTHWRSSTQRRSSLVRSLVNVSLTSFLSVFYWLTHFVHLDVNDVYETLNEKDSKLQYFCYDSVPRDDEFVYLNSSTQEEYKYKNLNNLIRDASPKAPQERINGTRLTGKLIV